VTGRGNIRDCDEATAALEGADRLVSRIQQHVADHLPPDSGIAAVEALGEIIEEVETAPEIDAMRRALGEDPARFGTARKGRVRS
jgi:hypothetical protein